MDGKKWKGKGKEYNSEGQLIYEGEYLYGKKWNGKRKEYDKYGCLKNVFEYINGEKKINFNNCFNII